MSSQVAAAQVVADQEIRLKDHALVERAEVHQHHVDDVGPAAARRTFAQASFSSATPSWKALFAILESKSTMRWRYQSRPKLEGPLSAKKRTFDPPEIEPSRERALA